jgi:hypothetical protein
VDFRQARPPFKQARARIAQFEQWAGRAVASVEIGDDSLAANAKPNQLFTVASFTTGGLVNLKEGTVNLTPLARTFADLPVVHVYVLLPHKTAYTGYFRYGTPHLQMWTDAQPTVWRTVLNIYTPDPAVLGDTRSSVPNRSRSPKSHLCRLLVRRWAGLSRLILLAALLVGAGIFWATTKLLQRQTEATTVQPETEIQ